MNTDLERVPLNQENQSLSSDYHSIQNSPRTTAKRVKKSSLVKTLTIFTLILALILIPIFTVVIPFKKIPTEDLQKYVSDITNVELKSIKFDGWSDAQESYMTGSQFNEKLLKLKVKLNISFDYDAAKNLSSQSISKRQRSLIKYAGNSLMRSVCFDLNNMTTYNDQNSSNPSPLASVTIPQLICVDFRDNVVTELEIPLLVQPHVKNIMSVIKKIWDREYKDLNLWSGIDASLFKDWFNLSVPLGHVTLKRLDWQDFISWEDLNSHLRRVVDSILELGSNAETSKLNIRDTENGFSIGVNVDLPRKDIPLLGNDVFKLPDRAVFPALGWGIRVPDCHGDYSIGLSQTLFSTKSIPMEEIVHNKSIQTHVKIEVNGPLPDELLYHVCSSDEENVVTPMNLLLNRIFNGTELVKAEVHDISYLNGTQNSIIPASIAQEVLPNLNFPIVANMTVLPDNIVDQVTIEGLKLKWKTSFFGEKKLNVMGKIVVIVNLPFYSPNDENSIVIKKIKGFTDLYHDGNIFITVPMEVWSDANSEILMPKNNNGLTKLRVTFDIEDDEVEIVDRLELSKCLNEILITGKSQVHVTGLLDLMTGSKLGDVVLLGLRGDGETVVKKDFN